MSQQPFLAYFINRLVFQSTISGLRVLVSTREAHIAFLTDKLKDAERQTGAMAREELPAGLKAQVQHLEESLQKIQKGPRTITNDQRKRFREAVAGKVLNQTVFMHCNSRDPECESYARELVQMFRDSDWFVGFSHIEEDLPSNEGLLLVVADPAHLIPDARESIEGAF